MTKPKELRYTVIGSADSNPGGPDNERLVGVVYVRTKNGVLAACELAKKQLAHMWSLPDTEDVTLEFMFRGHLRSQAGL